MTVPALVSTTAQSLEADQIVHLFELDLALIGGPVYRFTSSTLETKPVSFGGEIYSPSPVEASGFEMTSQGTLPRPTIKVANVAGIFSAAINEFGDLVGCVIRRIRTFRRFLDGEADADPDAHFPGRRVPDRAEEQPEPGLCGVDAGGCLRSGGAHAARATGVAKRLSADLPALDGSGLRLFGGDVSLQR